MSLTIYVEGGGNKDMDNRCREGFRKATRNVAFRKGRPKIVACGPRHKALDRFLYHLEIEPNHPALLLVDSEQPVDDCEPWEHLAKRDGWSISAAARDHVHLMATCMEAWIAADHEARREWTGANSFSPDRLPATMELERTPPKEMLHALADATAGKYMKGRASYQALSKIDLKVVADRLHYCRRFVDCISE